MAGDQNSILTVQDCATELWIIVGIEACERVFAPTEVIVRARTSEPPDLEAMLGKEASVELRLDDAPSRFFHGVVVDASDIALSHDAFEVELQVHSSLALLRWGRDHRIFQEQTVEEVVSDVLARAGVDAKCEWMLNGSYEPHANIVQYAESDYAFVTRLLFEEGIGFFIQQSEDDERVFFFDDDGAYLPISGESLLNVQRMGGARRQGLSHLARVHRVAPDQVSQRDYDLENPSTDLTTNAESANATGREVYLHPGQYTDSGRGQQLTDRTLERLRARCTTTEGSSNVPALSAGSYFTSAGSPRAEADGDHLILEVNHHLRPVDDGDAVEAVGQALDYENTFESIPLDVPYRPLTAAPAPTLCGPQHAIVTVPGGEEIHADENGRTKVRFLWDRSGIVDDKSSTWLRVGQLALGGSMVMPRIDFEVLVDFELGDLDRPAVSGHLYNAELPPPYALPGGATVSSMQTATTEGGPGANELRYEDAAGSEEIFLNASKDMNASVDNNTSWSVGANQTVDVGSNNTLSVTSNTLISVAGNRTLDVGANQSTNVGGDLGDGVGADLSVSIGGNRMVQVGGDHSENTNGSLTRTVGSLQCLTGIAGYSRTVVGDATIDVGAAWAEMAGGARSVDIAGSYSETIGALKFIMAKNITVGCEATYVMNGAAELVKAGGGRTDNADGVVSLTAGGALTCKAKNIVFEADSKLVFRAGGVSIELTKAGAVTVKAPSITIKNAKVLNQIMHKSN
ncbi:MAG: type VI secretion system Vgr family protein [Sandaracinaceae bacterium]